MDAKRISEQLRLAFRDCGLTLWEVARRADLSSADAAAVLGRAKRPPVDLVEAVGYALGLELAFVPATDQHALSCPRTVVDEAVASVAPERAVYSNDEGIKVLAMDLEATLISDAVSALVRPRLYEFLEAVHSLFERVVVFTTVPEPKFRELALAFLQAGSVPPWFVAAEYVRWTGFTKDLNFIRNVTAEQVLLVDDMSQAVHPGQEAQWVRIAGYEPPFDGHDEELLRVLEVLVDRVVGRGSHGKVRPANGDEAVKAFITQQRGLLGRLEAFARTPGFEHLLDSLRRGGAEGSKAWLAAWLIQPAFGLGQVPLDLLDLPDGLALVNQHLLRVLINPGGG